MRAPNLFLLMAASALTALGAIAQAPHPIPAGAAGQAKAAAATSTTPAQEEGLTGRLLERIPASPYCYLRLQTPKGEVWAAIPEVVIELGAEITVVNPMPMGNFESKALKRTFPEIFFGTAATVAGATTPPGHPGRPNPVAEPLKVGKIQKASGTNALQVADIWKRKGGLKDKTVTLRGKVMQYTSGILGKNWVHLQDGSGDAKKGTHDITLTTQDKVAKGDVVTFQGIVRLKKDFGSGYAYEVIIEEASIVKTWRSTTTQQ